MKRYFGFGGDAHMKALVLGLLVVVLGGCPASMDTGKPCPPSGESGAFDCSTLAVTISTGDKASNGQTCNSGKKCSVTNAKCPSSTLGPYTCKTVITDPSGTCDCKCSQ
jgi:hypothetical protein